MAAWKDFPELLNLLFSQSGIDVNNRMEWVYFSSTDNFILLKLATLVGKTEQKLNWHWALAEVESPAITCDLDMSLNCLWSVGSTPPAPFPCVRRAMLSAGGAEDT